MIRLSPGWLGALGGGIFGFLWVNYEWKTFLLLFFILIGYLLGKLFDSEEVREKLRDLFEALMTR